MIKAAELLGMWLLFAMPIQLEPHQLTCLPVGITAILAAWYLPGDSSGSEG